MFSDLIPRATRVVAASLLAVGTASVLGCGGPGKANVSGLVRQADGSPVPMGSVKFVWKGDGVQSRTGVIEDGKYTVEGVLEGPNVVVVETPHKPPKTTTPKRYVTVPAKYTDADKSDLRVDVKGPTQTYDMTLTP